SLPAALPICTMAWPPFLHLDPAVAGSIVMHHPALYDCFCKPFCGFVYCFFLFFYCADNIPALIQIVVNYIHSIGIPALIYFIFQQVMELLLYLGFVKCKSCGSNCPGHIRIPCLL